MKIGVTGASGHIGNNLVHALLDEGHTVSVFIHQDSRALHDSPVKIVQGDLLSEEDVEKFAAGLDVIYHLAAHIFIGRAHKNRYFEENIRVTQNILRVVTRFNIPLIHFSSIHAHDPFPINVPLDEQRPLVENDVFLYNRSKAITHRMVKEALSSGLRGAILSPTAVLGPGDYKPSMLGSAIWRLATGKMPALIPGGYDWVDVRDVADAAVQILKNDLTGEEFLISGHWVSLKELNDKIIRFGYKGRRLPVIPGWLALVGAPFLELLAVITGHQPLYTSGSVTFLKHSHRHISAEKAFSRLGYRPRPFDETLVDTIEWLKQSGKE